MIELTPALTITWVAIPFFIGFSISLLPQLDRLLAFVVTLVSIAYAGLLFVAQSPQQLELIDNFGVTLIADSLSGFFILTNGLVTLAILLYCWRSDKTAFFYTQLILLHGSVNAAFLCADFVSLYVALEVISIASFLLVTYSRSARSIWFGLRYLFISNTAMLFYLVGVALVYKATDSFRFEGLSVAPPEAIALIFLGLLVKGGIFVSGLWLPQTHTEADTPVSAMLSGVVVKVAILGLVRCALVVPEVEPIVRMMGVATALFGVGYAVFEKDSKRMLAFHTVSQLGFVLAAPPVAGFYALTHGLVKAALFLVAGSLPSRNFKELNQQPIARSLWLMGVIAAFSISGLPLLAGFGAKTLTVKALLPWQAIAMNIAAVGTAISFAKFIFLPQSGAVTAPEKVKNLWPSMVILLGGLFIANGFYPEAYSLENIAKALITIVIGWALYLAVIKKISLKLPRMFERLEHLIGVMSLTAVGLFLLAILLTVPEGAGG
ncbi:MAG: cation:proton antiporter [Oscillatoriales cyanobacterium]|nr:MAG: cation:proton antiporter [Oscillatoriales cyanobacterium]